ARCRRSLLDLDRGAGFLELPLDRVGLLAGDAFLDRLGSRVDEVLRLLEAQPRDRTDDLDHLDLLAAGRREEDVERRLLLLRRGAVAAAAATRRRHGNRRGRRNAPLVHVHLLHLVEVALGPLSTLVAL